MYVEAWEFVTAPGCEAEFERAYGAGGDWVQLFRQDPAYAGTDLFRDTANPRRYLTVDRWTSEAAYREFASRHGRQYQDLDQHLAPLCASERRLGSMIEAPDGGLPSP